MNWYKLFCHDLRCGLLRKRYLIVPFLFLLICAEGTLCFLQAEVCASVGDYLLYCFRGAEVPKRNGELPVLWLLVMGGSLYINLGYFTEDLADAGLQYLIRSRSKKTWYLAKCGWLLASCFVYFALGTVTILVYAVCRGSLALQPTAAGIAACFSTAELQRQSFSAGEVMLFSFLLPWAVSAAISALQMALCMSAPLVLGFFLSIWFLLASVFIQKPLFVGNGAMLYRSNLFAEQGMQPGRMLLYCGAVFLLSAVVGYLKFKRTDILGRLL